MTSATIDALTDLQAIRVLALVVDHHTPLPDPTRLRELDTALAHAADDPDLRPYHRPGARPPGHGDLARATLTHLSATRPELALVIDRAVHLADDTTRFEPAPWPSVAWSCSPCKPRSKSSATRQENGSSGCTRKRCATPRSDGSSDNSWRSAPTRRRSDRKGLKIECTGSSQLPLDAHLRHTGRSRT